MTDANEIFSTTPLSPLPAMIPQTNTTPTSTLTFSLFTKLPPELRTIIWHLALPDPRLIPIRYIHSTSTYTSRIRSPTLLHACQESRAEAKKIYQELNFNESASKFSPGCWIDLYQDQIYLSTDIKPIFNSHGRMILSNTRLQSLDYIPRYMHCSRMRVIREAGYDLRNVDRRWFNNPNHCWSMTERAAAKKIVSDLLDTFVGLSILQDFVVDFEAWELIGDELLGRRYEMKPFPIESLCVVMERGEGPLVENAQLVDHENDLCRDDDNEVDEDECPVCGNGLHEALAWQGNFYNGLDMYEGREAVLESKFDVKYLDTVEWVAERNLRQNEID